MKSFIVLILILITQTTFCQIPDTTLTELFEGFNPSQLLRVISNNLETNELTKEYLVALSYKIPILNPVSNRKITSQFGYRIHPMTRQLKKHEGIDMKAERGQAIYAAADGKIVEIGYHQFLGNYIKIKHLLGFVSVYGHLEATKVEINSHIYQGQHIGFCGNSGRTTGVHLHFSIIYKGKYLNPYSFIF